jgi:hypothetical protein
VLLLAPPRYVAAYESPLEVQSDEECIVVLVSVDSLGNLPRPSLLMRDLDAKGIQQREQIPRFVLAPSPNHDADWRGWSHRDVDLRPLLPMVTVIADELPPFLAATVELSIESSSISTLPSLLV